MVPQPLIKPNSMKFFLTISLSILPALLLVAPVEAGKNGENVEKKLKGEFKSLELGIEHHWQYRDVFASFGEGASERTTA